LLKAKINLDESNPALFLTQDLSGVYADADPRSYQLSSYSYLILPTVVAGQFNEEKGKTLAAFSYYAMCQAQQQSASLGYSPMPVNLVEAGFEQIRKIPGAVVQDINIASCKNPTFSADGTNVIAKNAPQPLPCDKQGVTLCPNGTGGLPNVPTAVTGAPGIVTPPSGTVAPGVTTPGGVNTPTVTTPGGAVTGPTVPGAVVPGATTPDGGTVPPVVTTPDGGTVVGGVIVDGSQTCDPDTGACGVVSGGVADQGGSQQVALGPVVGGVVPTVIGQDAGAGPSVVLVLLIIVLLVGLVAAPALAWRHYAGGAPQ